MGTTHKLCLAAVTLALTALGSSAQAFAAGELHPQVGEFGSFTNPNGIAIDEATGDVYVADIATGTIYKFDESGTPVSFSAFETYVKGSELTGTPSEPFSFPSSAYGTPAAIAVDNSKSPSDPSAGDLYVMDAGHGVIDKFSPTGEYINQIAGFPPATGSSEGELLGIAVDSSGDVHADIWPPNQNGVAVDVFDDALANILVARQLDATAGEGSVGFPGGFSEADGFAVGPTGDSFMLHRSCSCVGKLGQRLAPLGVVQLGAPGDVAVAADPATGHVFVDNQSALAEWDTGPENGTGGGGTSGKGNASTQVGSAFGSLSGSSGQGGVAVNGASGRIYASSPGEGKVLIFGSLAPAIVASAASGIGQHTATLNGSVDPRGTAVTSCEFEYGVADDLGRASYEHEAPCAQAPSSIGSGTTPVPVSAAIEGLESGMLYRFRLVAVSTSGLAGESAGLLASAGEGFGVKSLDVSFLNEDGTPDTQAGSHPYELVNSIVFNSHFARAESNADSVYVRTPDGTLKDLALDLPPGLVGDPSATPKKCTPFELHEHGGQCAEGSLVGDWHVEYSSLLYYGTYKFDEPMYNMVTPRGVALQLGVHYDLPNLFINNGVRAGGDYPVQATVINAPASAPVFASVVTIHGVVGEGTSRKAFLTLPTACNGPLRSSVSMDSYQDPGHFVRAESVSTNSAGQPVALTGCSKLQFPPTISVKPDTSAASTSSGLTVGVHVPQTAALNPEGLAESSLRDTTVTLPEGMAINPSGSDALEACTSDPGALAAGALGSSGDQIGYLGDQELNKSEEGVMWNTFTPERPNPLQPGSNFCPDGSKIGTLKIKTPLLEHELEGSVYLATQNSNPFASLLAMYLVAEDPYSGTLIKLAGDVKLTATGQIITTFKNTPDLPFEDLELHFFGGERAPLSTPARCGTYTTTAVFTPWDGNGPVTSTSSFEIEHGPGGGPCPGQGLPFSPSLTAGSTNVQAGAFSPFTMTMSRPDGSQNLDAIQLHMPPGLSGTLAGVELCPEPQADQGTCGPNSQIGETIVSVGVGNDPFTVTGGKVFLTGRYEGAPYGLSIVNPAKAGPFDLENTPANHPACDCLVVRAKIEVDPTTAALTVTSDTTGPYRIPTMIEGIPLQIQHINVSITRPGFTFNPTNCSPMAITGALTSSEGATDALSVPFQVTNCARLAFKPQFRVGTSAHTSRANGASLDAKLSYPSTPFGTQTNIAKVKVELPKQLPSRLTTLQKACVDTVFDTDRSKCPAASKVGEGIATTPILPTPLSGPAYFVSHGGARFPELIIVLSGYGTTIELHGETFINKAGITSSTFPSVPDVPVGTFELKLPEKPDSALAANGDLCAQKMVMPTTFTAQSGAVIEEKTPIAVEGCKPAIRVLRHSVKGKWATLLVSVPTAGRLVADGGGVLRTTRKISKAGTIALKLRLSKREQRFVAHHHARRLRVPITLSFKPARGRNLKAVVAVLMR